MENTPATIEIPAEPNTYCHSHPIGNSYFEWENGGHAVKLKISNEMKEQLRRIPRGEEHQQRCIIARDELTGKWFAIRHHPCWIDSWDCCCAAQAQEVNGPGAVVEWETVQFPDLEEHRREIEEAEEEERDREESEE